MAFPVIFMYNNEPMNKIPKNPQTLFTLTGTLRDECSIVNPEILVEADTMTSQLQSPNYAYIGVFNRFYYIKDIVAFRSYEDENHVMHNLWKVTMHCDVLKTFADAILDSPAIIAKTAGDDFNLYLPDPNFRCQQNELIGMVNFPNGFDMHNARYYLTFFG